MSTPSPLKRKSSSPKTPPSKRQRRQTKKFEFGDDIPHTASAKKKSEPIEIAFDKGSYLAIRADGGNFYVCQALQNVTEKAVKAQKNFRIRWLEVDKAPNIFKVAYDDLLDPQTVIGEVNVRKVDKVTFRVEDGEVNRIHQLLKASEKGADPYKLDRSLFEPLSKKRKVKEEDESDTSGVTPVKEKGKKKDNVTAKKTVKPKEKREPKAKRERAKKDAPVRKKRERKRKEEEDSEEEEIQEPPPLRRVKSHPPKPSLAKAATITLKKQQSLTSIQSLKRKATLMQRAKELKKKVISSKIKKAAAKGKVSKERKQRLKKPPKPKVDRTDPNRKLIPNEAVTVREKDPLFESKENVPFVSVKAHTKLLIRAVLLKDHKLLQELMKDSKRVGELEESRSLNVPETALHYAIKNEDHKTIKLLKEEIRGDYSKRHGRAAMTRSVLTPESTGTYNWRSLGIRKIRKVQISRGGKEGNNALTKDLQGSDKEGWLEYAIKHQVSPETIDLLVAMGFATEWSLKSSIVHVVRTGNRKLAAKLVEKGMKTMDCGFNALHKEVLEFSGKEALSMQLREASVKKNPSDNRKMTPIHCAAINPNSKYLEQLLAACPEFNIEDEDKWRPIHYAAICEGTGPLEYLLKQGISAEEGNKEGLTPIILACQAGRHLIVDLLLKKAREREASVEVINKKAGPGGVNRALKTSWCPIHFAVAAGHIEVVKVLLENGGDVNRPLNATFSRATPMMIAAQNGDLEMVKFLVSRKAKIEMLDKLKRTAVAYACVDGSANVLSYLLSKGSNPNNTDTSGNSALHYACAYGWYFCVKLLLEAGANPDPNNDWKLTPMGAAYLKGHHGLARFMLDIPEVNVDFQDEQGLTVLMRAIDEHPLTEEAYEEVKYLIKERGSDPNVCDKQGRNAFHHLVNNSLPVVNKDDYEELHGAKLSGWEQEQRDKQRPVRKEAEKNSKKIADLLFEVNCDVTAQNNDKETVTDVMFEQLRNQNADSCNLELLKRILELTGEVSEESNKAERGKELRHTILHTLAQRMDEPKNHDVLYFIAKLPLKSGGTGMSILKKMAQVRDHRHYTPFMVACDKYQNLRVDYQWSMKAKKQRGKQWKDFLAFFIKDLGSELEYQFDVKDTDGNVTRKDWVSSMFFAIDAMSDRNQYFFNFLLRFNANVDLPMSNNRTKLIENARHCNLGVVQRLLEVGADVNRRFFDEKLGNLTPLLLVLKEGRNISNMVYLLISNGADVNAERHDTRLNTEVRESALHIAVTNHSNAAVVGISTINMADINFASPVKPRDRTDRDYEFSPVPEKFHDVASGDMIPVVAMLLKAGVSLDVQDRRGCTALHILADKSTDNADESKDLEQMLIKKGANLFLKDSLGRLPLHYLFTKLSSNACRSEITGQMDPVESFSIFASAMKYQQLDVVDDWGRSPLHYAACRGATVCCMLLVQKGCDVNKKDKEDNMPLSLCVRYHHDSCALTLMQKGADINGDIITDPYADKPPKEDKEGSQENKKALMNGTAQESDSDDDSDDDDYWSDMDYSDSDDERRRANKKSASKKKKGLLTVEEIRLRIKNKKVRDAIKWTGRHYPSPWKPRPRGHPIFQGIVQNGWQGLTFIAMDLLEPFGMQYASAVEIAIKILKYRFALTLMNKQMDDEKLRVCNSEKQNLLHTLASTATGNNWELQKRIVEDLLVERKVPLNDVDSSGITALEYSILQNNWDLVRLLLARSDVKVTAKDKYNRTCVTALLWKMPSLGNDSSVNDPVKQTLDKLANLGAEMNELFDFPPLDTFRGGFRADIHPDDYFQSFPQTHKTTCLIQALCHSSYYIAVALLKNSASVNVTASNGMTPLMYAATLNDSTAVEILLKHFKHRDDLYNYLKKQRETDEKIMQLKIKKPEPTLNDPFKGFKVETYHYEGNINAQDKDGRTVFHHLVTSLPTGSFENISLLKKLSSITGADWNIKDKAGLTPLDHAVKRGAHSMVAGLQQLSNVKPKMTKKMSTGAKGFPQKEPVLKKFMVDDGIKWDGPAPDFVADADEILRKLEEEEMEFTEEDTKPDHRTSIAKGYVVKDKEQDVLYDILMTKVDVRIGEWGLYNFYKMQVVYDTEKKMNILFTCWGRIGDEGQYQRTPYGTEEEACQEFAKIFKAKSGNEWTNIKNFEVQPKKYRLVEAKYRKRNDLPDVKFDLDSKLPSKLNPYLQEVVRELSNVSMLRTQVRRTGIAVPFGRLKREQLQNALDLLQQLKPLAKEKQELQSNLTTETMEEYREVCQKISELSSEYYFIVPQQGYQFEKLVPLDNENQISRQIQGIFSLMELETAGKLLLASQLRVKELNPLDYIYHALRINLQLLDEKDPMLKIIMRYIYNTSNVDVEAIYAVTREGESERMEKVKLDNHKLLWHGSRTSNLISIFHKGLLIAPDEAASLTGAAFGKGIYSADTFQKSQGYCYNDAGGHSKYMLLCEVALGKEARYEYVPGDVKLPPEGYDSLRGNASQIPNPDFNAAMPTGVTVPLGTLVQNREPYGFLHENYHSAHGYHSTRCFSYNEFIVYKEDQVALRYIVQYR